MGMDCYIRAADQTEAEKEAQITGFDITKGDVGYLRESIGGVHAATWLFPEAFADDEGSLEGPRTWYSTGGERQMAESIFGFFNKEAEKTPGMTIEGPDLDVAASGFPPEGYCVEAERVESEETYTFGDKTETWTEVSFRIPVEVLKQRLPLVEALVRKRYGGDPYEEQAVKSYYSFVEVYEALEAEGRQPSIYVSY